MSLQFGFKTDVGLKRRANQDSYVIVRGESLSGVLDALFVVADGMGGRLGGEVASEIVVRTIPESVKAYLTARSEDKSPVDTSALLETAIREAHLKVRERQASEPQLSGMGTTCVAAVLDGNILTIANVGDSRAYLLRGGRLTQITEDHSSVWEQVVAGIMTPEEARTSRFRNQITRAIGSDVSAEPDIDKVELQEGDSVLLCSDGLTSEVDDDDIARLLAGEADPNGACDKLVEAALGAGGRDNVTVIALRYGAFSPIALEKKARVMVRPSDDALESWREADPDGGVNPRNGHYSSAKPVGAGRRPSVSPVLLLLLFVLAVLAGGEAYALVRLTQNLDALRRRQPEIIVRPPDRPTDRPLTYGDPSPVSSKVVRETPLAVDDEGSTIAETPSGRLVRFGANGQLTLLPDQGGPPVNGAPPVRGSILLATDVSGNRYQINPGYRVILKYDAEGNLASGNIGSGKLVSPTAIAVDSFGNLYVIDDHRVKKFVASDTAKAPARAPSDR